ncbi:MAG: 2-phosphosulfolactate phosphatase [Planctomycetaceae bacterium]
MSRELRVHFLPDLFEPDELRGEIAVVIDVLRASTTIIHALAAGALAVIPCDEIDVARRVAANRATSGNSQFPSPLAGLRRAQPSGEGRGGGANETRGRGDAGTRGKDDDHGAARREPRPPAHEDVLLGGERFGTRIEGFDLDNSPLNYSPDVVAGKTIAYTTTNGTRALLRSSRADRILVGALTNLDAIVECLVSESRPIHLVCAGTDGRITSEDVLCAGAVAAGIGESAHDRFSPDDQTDVAIAYFAAHSDDDCSLLTAIRESRGGRNLQELGLELDIDRAAMCNVYSLIPEYFPHTGRIELPGKSEARMTKEIRSTKH